MATITAGVMLMRWPLVSAVLMFLASTLNIQCRKSEYVVLAVVSSILGVTAACWFATGLLGLTLGDMATSWSAFKGYVFEVMSHAPPEWPMP